MNKFLKIIKNILAVVALVFVGVFVDYVFALLQLPIVITDLVLLPLSLLIIYFSFSSDFRKGKYLNSEVCTYSLRKRVLIVATLLGFVVLGCVVALLGADDCLALYSGAKGSVHGYTLFFLGLAIALFSAIYVYLIVFKRAHA